jgi:hypothetical protein
MRKKEDNYTEGNKQRRYKEMKPLNINHIQWYKRFIIMNVVFSLF